MGLWAFSGLKVVTQAFFSLKDTKTPLWVGIGAVVVNTAGGLLLMGPMAQGGLALATSVAAGFNVLVLFFILVRRLGQFPMRDLATSLAKICAASAVMGFFLMFVRDYGHWQVGLTPSNGMVLAACVLGGLVIFAAAALLLGCKELRSLVDVVLRRR
jgi:putative peptidoglycan lipid II flippase